MKRGCDNEFPFFGANYPDARCETEEEKQNFLKYRENLIKK